MCGIVGFTHKDRLSAGERIRKATATLLHRGPDQQGVFETDNISLGAVRLKIIDRALLSLIVGWGAVHDPRSRNYCWLYPLRDLMGFGFWLASYFSDKIRWRGERYRLEVGGKMVRIT